MLHHVLVPPGAELPLAGEVLAHTRDLVADLLLQHCDAALQRRVLRAQVLRVLVLRLAHQVLEVVHALLHCGAVRLPRLLLPQHQGLHRGKLRVAGGADLCQAAVQLLQLGMHGSKLLATPLADAPEPPLQMLQLLGQGSLLGRQGRALLGLARERLLETLDCRPVVLLGCSPPTQLIDLGMHRLGLARVPVRGVAQHPLHVRNAFRHRCPKQVAVFLLSRDLLVNDAVVRVPRLLLLRQARVQLLDPLVGCSHRPRLLVHGVSQHGLEVIDTLLDGDMQAMQGVASILFLLKLGADAAKPRLHLFLLGGSVSLRLVGRDRRVRAPHGKDLGRMTIVSFIVILQHPLQAFHTLCQRSMLLAQRCIRSLKVV
mmetsp:Transcript_109425/g.349195  ORF Transcript_109425/g.349195 Transcript_109425/m.349195 type:complete len:371 (+) Transcript_109425:1230-2342(+)